MRIMAGNLKALSEALYKQAWILRMRLSATFIFYMTWKLWMIFRCLNDWKELRTHKKIMGNSNFSAHKQSFMAILIVKCLWLFSPPKWCGMATGETVKVRLAVTGLCSWLSRGLRQEYYRLKDCRESSRIPWNTKNDPASKMKSRYQEIEVSGGVPT